MVLQSEPPEAPEVSARRVASIEELRVAAEIAHQAFGDREERLQAVLENLVDQWENHEGKEQATFLAFADGLPVGTARSVYLEQGVVLLVSGGVLEEARGHGAYRALVRARWDDAVERKTPLLLVFGGPMSRPILERVGFEPLFELMIMADDLG
jgi:GNAT superfamily N-acetyltransferase